MTSDQVFVAERVVDGHAVTFLAALQGKVLPPKLIHVNVHGGGFGSVSTWPEALAMAREYVGYVIKREAELAAWKATSAIDRATVSARHEAKQRARAQRDRGQHLVLPIVCARQASAS